MADEGTKMAEDVKVEDAIPAVEPATNGHVAAPEVKTEAAPVVPEGEVATTPTVGSDEWLNDPNTSREDLLKFTQAIERGEDPTKTEEAKPEDIKEPEKAEVKTEEVKVNEPITFELPPLEIAEDADYDTFKDESTKWLEGVEIAPEVETILNRYQTEVEALQAKVSEQPEPAVADEVVTRHMGAFDKLVEFVQDPETGKFVPDTSAILGLLEKEYSKELPQVVIDINSQPSQKYPNLTLYQEFLIDNFELDNDSFRTLNYFLQNNGQMPFPQFVPERVDVKLAEAFWTSPSREDMTERVDEANRTLNDPDSDEWSIANAKKTLQNLNADLAKIQSGLDANRQRVVENKTAVQQTQTEVHNAAVDRFVDTTRGIIEVIATKAVTGLENVLDSTGANLVGTGIGTLIEASFSDVDGYAKYAQNKLKEYGITADWIKAHEIRDRLFESEKKIVSLERSNSHELAIKNARRQHDGIIKELIGLANEAGGKINAKVISGVGEKLTKQIEKAPRVPAVRPKAASDAVNEVKAVNYEDMPLNELQAEIRKMREQNPYRAALFGQ